MSLRTKVISVFGGLAACLLAPASGMTWSWTSDPEGQKLDQEARHWLTTQNVCGVQLKQDYLSDLDARIIAHFTSLADEYRRFLLSSVLTANANALNDTKPDEVKKECEARANEAAAAGVLADPGTKPYLWAVATLGAPPAAPPAVSTSSTATAPSPPKLADFFGAWSEMSDKCQSYKAKTEGPWFVIQEKSFTSEGGGQCKRPTYTLKGNSLTVTTRCSAEEAGFETYKETFTLTDGRLKSLGTEMTYMRCSAGARAGK